MIECSRNPRRVPVCNRLRDDSAGRRTIAHYECGRDDRPSLRLHDPGRPCHLMVRAPYEQPLIETGPAKGMQVAVLGYAENNAFGHQRTLQGQGKSY